MLRSLTTKSINPQGILILQMNNKPVNALTSPLMQELKSELDRARKDPNVKGIILGSSLPKVFSAGLDLKTLVDHEKYSLPGDGSNASEKEMLLYRKHIYEYMGLFSSLVELLLTTEKPTASILKGHAPAGGTVLALCCDVRIGSDAGFSMGLNEVQVGMDPPLWVHRLLLNTIGNRQSSLAMQKGTIFSSKEECLKIGIVDRIVPDGELLSSAENELMNYLKLPHRARAAAKLKSVENVSTQFTDSALDNVVDSIAGPEFQITVKDILEKLQKK